MSKSLLSGALVASLLVLASHGASADSGHEHGSSHAEAKSLPGAWSALMATRDAIASDIANGALGEIHARSEALPGLVAALIEQSADLDAAKRARVEGAGKQVGRVADALHVAADGADADRTRKELGRLDGLLELIRVQYRDGALGAGAGDHGGHSATPGHAHGAHAHADRPAGVVDAAPKATIRVQAFDPFRFEPKRIDVQAGVPTRIELENVGVAEHSLVVKSPDGKADWVHLHVPPGETEAATYQLDEPGTYAIRCTIPGHTEGGMIGELVVARGRPRTPLNAR